MTHGLGEECRTRGRREAGLVLLPEDIEEIPTLFAIFSSSSWCVPMCVCKHVRVCYGCLEINVCRYRCSCVHGEVQRKTRRLYCSCLRQGVLQNLGACWFPVRLVAGKPQRTPPFPCLLFQSLGYRHMPLSLSVYTRG